MVLIGVFAFLGVILIGHWSSLFVPPFFFLHALVFFFQLNLTRFHHHLLCDITLNNKSLVNPDCFPDISQCI